MLPSLIEELYKVLRIVIATLWTKRQTALNLIVVFVAAVVVGQLWYSSEHKQLVMFVGSRGSNSATIGPKIVGQIATTRNPNAVPYNIVLEPTLENISIRERMTIESNRVALGIIEDGQRADGSLEEAGELRVLLPMEWDYLFVLCSRDLFKRAKAANGKDPDTLAEVLDEVGKGKLFLGAETSTSHRLAKFALDKFDISMIEKTAKGIADWREMRTAFRNGELDLAFYSGPLGSKLIEEVAADKTAVLLGLGKITEAIQYESGFQVYSARLPENLVIAKTRASKPDVAHEVSPTSLMERLIATLSLKKPDPSASVAFSRPNLMTIASRRVLACPRSLSTADAYLLASAARAALIEEGYFINLQADDLPLGSDQKTANPLRMPLHPGLEKLREGQTPVVGRDWTTWPGWFQAVVSILLGLLAIDALRLFGGRLGIKPKVAESNSPSPPTTEPQSTPTTTDDFKRYSIKLKGYENQVDAQTHHETAGQMGEWDRKLTELKNSIKESNQLTQAQRDPLLHGIRMLRNDIASSMHWITKSDTKRRKEKLPTEPFESESSAEQRPNPIAKQSELLPDPSVDAS